MNLFFGQAVRNIPNQNKTIYLTFDDGPCRFTSEVLQVLSDRKVQATFFVIANSVKENKDIFAEIKAQNHAFGNHSLDHLSRKFFTNRAKLLDWVRESEDIIQSELQTSLVGFRPPAGVCTPPLKWSLAQLKIPLILWKIRFYDAVFPWKAARAFRSLEKTTGGDIILLHDRQKLRNQNFFLKTLEVYIDSARQNGFKFEKLDRKLCEQAIISK